MALGVGTWTGVWARATGDKEVRTDGIPRGQGHPGCPGERTVGPCTGLQ